MHETGPPYRLYRNRALTRLRAVLLWLLGGLIVASATLAATQPPDNSTSRPTGVVLGAFGLLFIWLGFRIARSGIITTSTSVTVRRVLRRQRRVSWTDVAGFEIFNARLFNNRFTRNAVAIAVLRPGYKPLYCIGASFAEPQPAADEMLKALRAELDVALPNSAFI